MNCQNATSANTLTPLQIAGLPVPSKSLATMPGPCTVGKGVNILVNATSIGLFPEVNAMPPVNLEHARPDLLVCDVVPNPPDTRLIQAARARGLKTINGLSMLVYQGSIGFEMWTGHKAPEDVMKRALRDALGIGDERG